MKYYRIKFKTKETKLEATDNGNMNITMEERFCRLNDDEAIEEFINDVYTPQDIDGIHIEYEVEYTEATADDFIESIEKNIKNWCVRSYKMKMNGDKPVREYNVWDKGLTEDDKKDLYAEALEYYFMMVKSPVWMKSNYDIDKMPVGEFFEMLNKLVHISYKDARNVTKPYLDKYGKKIVK